MLLSEGFQGFRFRGEREGEPLKVLAVRQSFDDTRVSDVKSSVSSAVAALGFQGQLRPGARIMVTAGSRGIASITEILRAVCSEIRGMGYEPTVIGAMGSHGGGTVEGQLEVLESLGITESSVRAPVITSTRAVEVGRTSTGQPVYTDPLAAEADGVVAVNRVKPHTTARGDIQSGLVKMLVVGLGHQVGAESFHRAGPATMSEELKQMAGHVVESIPFLGGLAIVENAQKKPYCIEPVKPPELIAKERELLKLATDLLPRLPFSAADVLIVRSMGKNYSGTGVDTNVVGRHRVHGQADTDSPSISKLAVLDLSEESHGNATGIGLADFITSRLISKVDLEATYTNVFASTLTMRAMIPMIMKTDEDAVWASIASSNLSPGQKVRLALIDNTLNLGRFWVTPALAQEIESSDTVEVNPDLSEVRFDADGTLICPG